jgi:hypothetical protein
LSLIDTQIVPAQKAPASLNSARTTTGRLSSVRPLEERDLDVVAGLFLSRFRSTAAGRGEKARAELIDYMRQLYLPSPDSGMSRESLVHVGSDGAIGAFLGVVKTTFLLDGEVLSAGINGALMAAEKPGNDLAIVHLLRALLNGPLDFNFTDSANRSSLMMGMGMKYQVLHPNCLEWACIFQPAAAGLENVRQKWPHTPSGLLKPFVRGFDFFASQAIAKKMTLKAREDWRDDEIDVEDFVKMAPSFLEDYRLRPQWSAHELGWLVGQAKLRRGAGPLHLRAVGDSSGSIIGCYAFYGEKGGVASVIQVCARKNALGSLVVHIMKSARHSGYISVHGAAREEMMSQLCLIPGLLFYYGGSGTMLWTKRPDVIQAVQEKSIFLGGFAGDRWTRLANDQFG